jgi:acetyl-CoA carboxylase biotin carboxyl carrier protein
MKDTTESGIQYSFSYRDAVEVLKLIQESAHCQSLDLRIGDISLSLTRVAQRQSATARTAAPASTEGTTKDATTPESTQAPAPAPAPIAVAPPTQAHGMVEVITPTLGVFYRSPSPGAAPFVKEGDRVNAEDQIGLLEVMKLYMPVTAGVSGRIARILAPDGALVEHGQVLMLIEAD